jgi:hypothetical protein
MECAETQFGAPKIVLVCSLGEAIARAAAFG